MRNAYTKPVSAGLVLMLLLGLVSWSATPTAQAQTADEDFADPAFRGTWTRTDKPVADGLTSRTFIWGPAPFATETERYDSSPDGERLVQYFDKGRMEVTYPDGDSASPWYVTSGLLVRDMVAGVVQVGDNLVQVYDPVDLPVAGGDIDALPETPRYGDFGDFAFDSRVALSQVGEPILTTFASGGEFGDRDEGAEPVVNYGYYESTSHHNIAAPFWDFMNQTGQVYGKNDKAVENTVFQWQYVLGYPLTEPYWIMANVAGEPQEILVQLFQRRVLTYNPANDEAYQVEFTNVGRHWYQWQYGNAPALQGDLSVPNSINGTISPNYGNLDTVFTVRASGFKPNEQVIVEVTQPGGRFLGSDDLGTLDADENGEVRISFQGGSLANFDIPEALNESEFIDPTLGLYQMILSGATNQSRLYWRIVETIARTPNTPYNTDTTPPPASIGAEVDPAVGPVGTNFTAFVYDFQAKDFAFDRVIGWTTAPNGDVNGFDAISLLDVATETLDGTILGLGSPPTPGVWAVTLAYRDNLDKKAVIFIRTTEAPAEATVAEALSIYTLGTLDGKSAAKNLWTSQLKWANLKGGK